MMSMKLRFLVFVFFALNITSVAQQPKQSIRGKITDAMTGIPVPFATIIVLETEPMLGTVADEKGSFNLINVPVGRYDIQVSCIGYEPKKIKEVLVTSAKENYLNVTIQESVNVLDAVVIKPTVSKEVPLNKMAVVSARMLSVEEANRYAGGFDDPARLVSAFAGVASNTGNNGIVIRGNSPRMLLWKMEGIEIPNPNHFADINTFGGGALTALSSNLLANSDFFTGAFPAEYNNALSGVFDIAMRTGNAQNFENSFQLGIIGIDFASEGPLGKSGLSSYLFNYRYSTLSLVQPILPEDAEKINYQDLSFKINLPLRTKGSFKLWGIGLTDKSGQTAIPDSTKWKYLGDKEDGTPIQYMGALGLTYFTYFKNNTSIKTTAAVTSNGLDWKIKRLNNELHLLPQREIQSKNHNLVFTSSITKKFSNAHSNKTGFTFTGLHYNSIIKDILNMDVTPTELVNENGFSSLMAFYTSSAFRLSQSIQLTLGINNQLFTLNGNYSLEPRLGLKWAMTSNHFLTLGYGKHSRLEKINFYLTKSQQSGDIENKHMDFSKAHHFIFGYNFKISNNMLLKIEPYYQYLYSIPVIADSSYSFINLQNEWFFNEKLVNSGKGKNYGLDLSFEKYLSGGYYYMVTASFFRSKFKGGDAKWRNTAFDRRFLFNILGGKEWQVGTNRQNILGINTRISIQGGDPYTPVDLDASLLEKEVIYDHTNAFSLRNDPSFILHFTASYKINKQKIAQEIALKIINATSQNDFLGFRYNYITNTVDKHLEAVVIPNLSYKIEF